MIIEEKNFLTKEEQDFSQTYILSSRISMHYTRNATDGDDHPILLHILRENQNHTVVSDLNFFLEDIVKRFAKKHKIKIKKFLRASINVSFALPQKKSTEHIDHNFPHYNAIIYLDDCDGDTVIVKEKRIKVKPEKNKVLVFGGYNHYNMYPKQGRRIIGVVTWQ